MRKNIGCCLAGALALLSFGGCTISERQIVSYAVIAATAGSSIGAIIKQSNPPLGEQIQRSSDAVVIAAEEWEHGNGTQGTLVSSLNALMHVLQSIPSDQAQGVAALLPIAIAAIRSIFAIMGIAGNAKGESEGAFIHEWNAKAAEIPGAVQLHE